MHGRILFGVVAWLLGAATATAGSLLAVSLLGQGITGATGPLLSQVAVNKALASETAEPTSGAASSASSGAADTASPSSPASAGSPGATSTGAPSSGAASSAGASPSAAPSGTPASSAPATAPSASGTPDGGTVLASHGGGVVASCQAGGAYLDSWSPAQGFVVGDVRRGPAQVARVTFDPASDSGNSTVTMLVSCSAGIPSATTKSWAGDD